MKAVLISIQPKWCELIESGKKTIEVRKTRPKIETPFKCYIYATKPKTQSLRARIYNSYIMPIMGECGSGKVIGEFVCDKVERFEYLMPYEEDDEIQYNISQNDLVLTCIEPYELTEYGKGKTLYGWHITNLKIYNKPKELGDFNFARAPQSWRYVEVVKRYVRHLKAEMRLIEQAKEKKQ